jgi:tol-pal system-associated acyl-CoA thioesterase
MTAEFVLPVRVYLEDTDAQGVVYNASYFRFMERARTEWLRARGVDHEELLAEHGVVLVLAAIEARFKAPARLSDVLHVSASVGELICEGVAEVASKDATTGRPRRFPAALISEWQA